MARLKQFWIKERHNPQTGVYYVACGQLSKSAAKKYKKPIYGYNIMIPFDTEVAYKQRIDDLKKEGKTVR